MFEQSADLFQRRRMMRAGSEDVVELLNVLLEVEKVAEMCDEDASSGRGVYVTGAGVQMDGPNECCALAAIELLDRDLFVRKTSGPYSKFFPLYPLGGKCPMCVVGVDCVQLRERVCGVFLGCLYYSTPNSYSSVLLQVPREKVYRHLDDFLVEDDI